jgi:hypothetical protein
MQYFTSIFWPSYSVLIKSVPSELDVPEKHTVYHIKEKNLHSKQPFQFKDV